MTERSSHNLLLASKQSTSSKQADESASSIIDLLKHPICFSYPTRLAMSAWTGHIPFAMFLVDVLRPKVFLELGTHYGVSYCAFCQAVKELQTDTQCFAVDAWEGDPHAGFYGPEVLAELREHHDPLYGGFSRLIKSDFNEAVAYFADQSVDLLHIDGYHTYEAVKQDFETWLPKMSDRGVVLFHDINVRERDFGVWKYWAELKTQYPSFEFIHTHGLGVLAVGTQQPPLLRELTAVSGHELVRIRESFYQLGARLEMAQDFQAFRRTVQESGAHAAAQLPAKDKLIEEQQQRLQAQEQSLQEQQQQLHLKEQQLQEQTRQLEIKDAQLAEQHQQLLAKDAAIEDQRHQLEAREQSLREQTAQLDERVVQLSERDGQLHAATLQSAEQLRQLAARDEQLQAANLLNTEHLERLQIKDEQLQLNERQLEEQTRQLKARILLNAQQSQQLAEHESLLEEQRQQLQAAAQSANALEVELQEQVRQLGVKEELLRTLTAEVSDLGKLGETRERHLQEMQQQFQSLEQMLQQKAQLIQEQDVQFQESLARRQELDRQVGELHYQLEVKERWLQDLLSSRALRIGSTLTWPVRKLRHMRFNRTPTSNNGHAGETVAHAGQTLDTNGAMTPVDEAVIEPVPQVDYAAGRAAAINMADIAGTFVIGIVTYNNSARQLAQLYSSIDIAAQQLAQTNATLRVFIIDNGAPCTLPPSTIETNRFASQGNIGFGKAMNVLLAAAFADPATQGFLCLNPDGVLHFNSIKELLISNHVHEHSLIEARQFPEEHVKEYDPKTLDTHWASGACLLIPRIIYATIGGFDPNFFMYMEDIDLSWRARAAGFSVKVSPNALFGHAVLNRKPDAQTENFFFLSGRYLALKWKNEEFLNWTEEELVRRGYFASRSELPPVPEPALNEAELDLDVPDFAHHFHFSPARW